MLSVPTLAQMLTVIGATLLTSTVLIVLANLVLNRVGSAPKPAGPVSQVPAQRSPRHRTPVTTH
ncbi:MAG TPA: hypothetical protein VLL08_14115 [Kineosporiaceae bacterium]|nr:hypothetical protein [Kineosporiaceae bacterium]